MAEWKFDDGGRAKAGYGTSKTQRDCVCRAIAIATGLPYTAVYRELIRFAGRERPRAGRKKRSHPDTGVHKATIRRYMDFLGWKWVPTMQIGSGCVVHLKASELPKGRIIVSVSRHLVAMLDGVIHDTRDPRRSGTRCVYGYYYDPQAAGPRLGDVTPLTTREAVSRAADPAWTPPEPRYKRGECRFCGSALGAPLDLCLATPCQQKAKAALSKSTELDDDAMVAIRRAMHGPRRKAT